MPENPLPYVAGLYLLVSAVTFVAYGLDKRRAVRGGDRIPERTLQTLALLGGWPGALLGRKHFRHKTRKRAFSATLYAIALLHIALWAWLLLR